MSNKSKILVVDAAQRLDVLLVQFWPELGRAALRELLQQGQVRINGEPARQAGQYVQPGDAVEVLSPIAVPAGSEALDTESLELVYADAAVIVVDKPAGMPLHADSRSAAMAVAQLLGQRYPEMAHVGGLERAGILQRLDADCSGLVLAARTEDAYRALKREAKRQRLLGQYVALVEGRLTGSGVIDAPIGNLKHEREQLAVAREGRSARTLYRPIHHYRNAGRHYTLLEVRPESARLHQIRVHLSWYGYPIVGDKRYGTARQPEWVSRLYLHLSSLTFTHPVTGLTIEVDVPLPAEMYSVLHFMGRRK